MARDFGLTFAIATILSLISMYQLYRYSLQQRAVPTVNEVVLYPLIRYWTLALVAVPVFRLAQRYPLRPGRVRRFLLIQCGAVVLALFAYACLRFVTLQLFWPDTEPPPSPINVLRSVLVMYLVENLTTFILIVVCAHAVQFYANARRAALREAELRAELVQYKLDVLRLQLQPHFLFNTLNGISALMATDVRAARTAIMQFSDLLRTVLAQSQQQDVRLADELEFVRLYLGLQALRLGDRLRFAVRADDELLDVRVPTMLLQPVVENAVRHGIEQREQPGAVEVDVRRDGSAIAMTVTNDAGAREAEGGNGIGLRNLESRLSVVYGNNFTLQLVPVGRERTRVAIRIPLPHPWAASAS